MTRLVCLSDTHLTHEQGASLTPTIVVPEGDILIHGGDLTWRGDWNELERAFRWIGSLPHPHKVVIAGNHDWLFDRDPDAARRLVPEGVLYLQDAGVEVLGLRFWGSPWTPRFMDWAFNLDRGAPIAAKWAFIPSPLDVLVTHGPPFGILDEVPRIPEAWTAEVGRRATEHAGCGELRKAVARVRPRVHVFGHIHRARGIQTEDGTVFVNASISDDMGCVRGHAAVVDLKVERDPGFKNAYPMCHYAWIPCEEKA